MVDIKNTTVFSTDRLTRKQKEKMILLGIKKKRTSMKQKLTLALIEMEEK